MVIRIQRLGRAHRERIRRSSRSYTLDRLMARMRDRKATVMDAANAQMDMLQFLGISALEWQAMQKRVMRYQFFRDAEEAIFREALAETRAAIDGIAIVDPNGDPLPAILPDN